MDEDFKPVSGGERRRQPRFVVNVEFSQLSADDIVYVSDLSVRGVFVQTTKPLPLNCEVALCFTVLVEDPIVIHCHGRVVRHQKQPSGLGVEFVGLDVQTTAQIRFVVAAQRIRERLEAGEPVSDVQRAAMEKLRKSPFDAQALKEIDALVNERPPDRIIVDLDLPIENRAKTVTSKPTESGRRTGEEIGADSDSSKPADSVVAIIEAADESEILLMPEGGARTIPPQTEKASPNPGVKTVSEPPIRGALPNMAGVDHACRAERNLLPGEAGAPAPELAETEADDDAVTHVFQSPFADEMDSLAVASVSVSSPSLESDSKGDGEEENSCVDRSAKEASGSSKM